MRRVSIFFIAFIALLGLLPFSVVRGQTSTPMPSCDTYNLGVSSNGWVDDSNLGGDYYAAGTGWHPGSGSYVAIKFNGADSALSSVTWTIVIAGANGGEGTGIYGSSISNLLSGHPGTGNGTFTFSWTGTIAASDTIITVGSANSSGSYISSITLCASSNSTPTISPAATSTIVPTRVSSPALLLGDSIAMAWPLPGITNGAQSGYTSDDLLQEWRQQYRNSSWKTVVVLIGTNDIGAGQPLEVFQQHIKELRYYTRTHNILLVLCNILPVDPSQISDRSMDNIRAFNGWLQSYSVGPDIRYVDLFDAMIDGNGSLLPNLTIDGVHPNTAGYAIMTPLVESAIEGQ
jgi:lysophospholipase L1-like esterase